MAQPRKCPICGKPADPAHHPFCSRGCKDRDLLAWLGEEYRLAPPTDEEDDAPRLDTPPTHD